MGFARAIRDMLAAFRADREREAGDGWDNVDHRRDDSWRVTGHYFGDGEHRDGVEHSPHRRVPPPPPRRVGERRDDSSDATA